MYSNTKEYTIAPSCPWYKEQQAYGPPNVNWCEPTQCAVINEPANAWTNLAYVLVAMIIIMKLNQMKDKVFRDFGLVIFVCGFFSFTYHASNNFFSQFFDFLGMYLVTSLPLALQTQRLRGKDPKNYHAFFWFYTFLGTCMFWFFTFWEVAIQHTIILQVLGILVLEVLCWIKEGKTTSMKYFWSSLAFMSIAQTFSQLDIKRIWCQPENVFLHGHALWHLLAAVGLFILSLHFREVMKKYKN